MLQVWIIQLVNKKSVPSLHSKTVRTQRDWHFCLSHFRMIFILAGGCLSTNTAPVIPRFIRSRFAVIIERFQAAAVTYCAFN